ncbi:MAG: universal stress protein [Gammaproteobacteria bacterium]|nr:universal stress protein [Gammaproteobacteria bacterium]TVQ49370.1 MAG: universal stress protein [Gammaproteobacteria bacterium]
MADKIIVFPTDFSKLSLKALPWVRRMAESLNCPVHCVFVVEEPQMYAALDMGPVTLPSPKELAEQAKTRLDAFIAEHLSGVSGVVSVVLVGRPAQELTDYAAKHAAELIIMTTHGYSGIRHVLLGSTTEAVLRQAPCPVLSVRNDDE